MANKSESRVIALASGTAIAPLRPEDLKERALQIQAVIQETMVEGVHYGVIPGTDSYSLLKEGADILLMTFNIAVDPEVTDLSTETEVRFQVKARGLHQGSGNFLGCGMGVCSSNEEKYRWRKAKSRAEWESTPERHQRVAYKSGAKGDYTIAQVRASPHDHVQTILAMAEKRARVDLAKTVLAAGDALKMYNDRRKANRRPSGAGGAAPSGQVPGSASPGASTATSTTSGQQPNNRPSPSPPASTEKPKPEVKPPAAEALISEEQLEHIARCMDNAGIPDSAFLASFELGQFNELPASRFEAALAWISKNSP